MTAMHHAHCKPCVSTTIGLAYWYVTTSEVSFASAWRPSSVFLHSNLTDSVDTSWEFLYMALHTFYPSPCMWCLHTCWQSETILHGTCRIFHTFRYDWSNDWRGHSSCNGRRKNLCPLSSWSLCSWQFWLWSNEGIPEQVDAGIRKWFQMVRHAFVNVCVWKTVKNLSLKIKM